MDMFSAADYFIGRHVREGRGNKVAIECGAEKVTYRELLENVDRTGAHLLALGAARGDRVLLLLEDTPAFAASFFGAMKIGAVPVPLNTLLMPADYEYIVRDSGARAAIVDTKFLSKKVEKLKGSGALEHIIVPGDIEMKAAPSADDVSRAGDAVPADTGDSAFWLYSSGSTGAPKACLHRGRDMAVCFEHYAKGILNINENDRCFSVSKLFFAYGLGNALYYPLAAGATSVLMPGPPKSEAVFGVIEKYRPTLFFSVPSNYAALLDFKNVDGKSEFDLSSVRCAVSAGEALPAALFGRFKKRFGCEILDGIGSTEALQAFITNRPGDIRPGSSGKIVPGYEAKILDDAGKPVAEGEVGDLFIKSEAICAGYWNQPEKTAATIKDGWLKTGDKYSKDKDGYFWYAGRGDDMFKASGVWISPVEIENVLMEHGAVLEAAVVGREDKDGLMKPVAYVILKNHAKKTPDLEDELQKFVLARLPVYHRPRKVEFVEELPKTATGKIQRFKLRAL